MCFIAVAASSCSTTRVLAEGEYRLAKNEVEINGQGRLNPNELQPYIKQKSNTYLIFGWNPFLNIYNWASDESTFINRAIHKIGTPPVVYEEKMVNASADNIRRHLEYLGYYGSEVTPEIITKRKIVKVKYKITLGKQYVISNIDYKITSSGDIYSDFMNDTTRSIIKPGAYLSEQMLEQESSASAERLRNLGYYGFSKNYYFFKADTLSNDGTASLEYRINNYTRNETPKDAINLKKYYFGDVVVNYPKTLKLREGVIRDLITIVPGELYRESVVSDTYSRLAALSALSGVNIETDTSGIYSTSSSIDTTGGRVNTTINLSSSKLQGFKFNLEASSNSSGLLGVSPGLSFFHKNLFHGGEVLNLNFMGNFQFKLNDDISSTEFGVSAGIRFPRFLMIPADRFRKSVPSTEIKASYNYQNRPEYKRNIISTSYGYTGSYKKMFFQFYPMQLNIVRLFNIDGAFYNSMAGNPFMRNAYQDHFDLGMGGLLHYTTSTDVIPRKSYHYFRFQANVAGNLISLFNPLMNVGPEGARRIWNTPYSQYIRGEFTAGKTWVFGKKDDQAIATRFLAGAGYAYGNSSALPFEQHFYSGGANSLRGWQARSVGPGRSPKDTSFVIPNQTGDIKLEANIEYRFPLFWKIDGAVFADAGNVWTLRRSVPAGEDDPSLFTGSNILNSIAMDWGAGLRLDLGFILIRVDGGFVVRDPSRSGNKWVPPSGWFQRDGFGIHFGVGYPF